MQVDIQDAGPSRKRLQITVPADRVRSHIEGMLRATSERVSMKGFRPGKVPREMVRKHLGPTILAEAKQNLIEETFREAVTTHKLEVLGQAKLDVAESPLAEDQELSYSVECEIKPKVKIGDVRSIEIQRQSVEATAEEVEEAIQQAAMSKRKLQVVAEPLQKGDFAKADMVYLLGGAEIVRKQGMQVNADIAVRGCDPEVFRAKLLGQKAGESVAVPIRFPDSFEKEEARGKDGELRIELHEVRRFVAPAVDDELAKSLEFESLAAMREQVLQRIADYKQRAEDTRIIRESLDHLFTDHPFDLPEGLIAEETKGRLEGLKQELTKQGGATEAEVEARIAEQREQVQEAARLDIRNLFLMEGIAMKEKLFVTETDVDTELKAIAAANNVTPAVARKHFEENKLLGQLRLDLMQRKVRDFLKQSVKLVDTSPAKA